MKILFKIKEKSLEILNKKKLNDEYKNMLNTNVINNNELVFSDEYIKTNGKIITSFLNELINEYHLTKIIFQNNEVANLIMPILPSLKEINSLYFASDEVFLFSYYEYIKKNKNIKIVNAKYIPEYLFEMLDKLDIIPEPRDEMLFTSNFMELNKLNNYASIYYKYVITMEFPLNKDDIKDFDIFCKINKNLKIINVKVPSREDLEIIISYLKDYYKKNVTIIINSDITDLSLIEYLQKNNHLLKKKYHISFKLKYSNYYIQENIISETNNRILGSCAYIIISIILFSICYLVYDNISSMREVAQVNNEIIEYINGVEPTEIPQSVTIENEEYAIKNHYLMALKQINNDVVAWVNVNNTKIDYAVVQGTDNSYYLQHNIYKEKTPVGWVFMDFENDPVNLNDNTILYAHNRYNNGVMFGTLSNTVKKDWYNNPENQLISLDTPYESYKFKVFSIYGITVTSDYLITNFSNDTNRLDFYNMLKKRSIHNFNVPLSSNDKILTLSTCTDHGRLVVHAVLQKEEENTTEINNPEVNTPTDASTNELN